MPKPELSTIPEFYRNYVKLVQEDNIEDALVNNAEETIDLLRNVHEEKWSYRYAEGKWSVKEMIQHIIDTERIFSYRALCFARGEKGSLPGFDEKTYAAASAADNRSKDALLEEFTIVRKSTIALFQSFTDDQLGRTGIANNYPVGVNGIGYLTAGHVAHHLNILKERYLQ